MRYVIWILVGVLVGWAAGQFIFPKSSRLSSERKVSKHPSGALTQTKAPISLTLPTVEAIQPSQAAVYWKNPPLAGTREAAEFHLGMLGLAETTPDIEAIARFINDTPDPSEMRDFAKIVFAALAERHPSAAFEAAKSLTDASIRNALMGTVIETWAASEPDGALAFIKDLPTEIVKENGLLDSAIRGMAKKDPRATLDKLAELSLGEGRHYAMSVDAWVSQDHGAALAWLQSLEDRTLKDQLIDQAIRSLASSSPETALEVTLAMPHEGQGRHPAQTMLQELAAMPIPGALENAVKGIHALPEDLRTKDFMRRFGTNAALNSPDKAIDLWEEIPNEAALEQGYWEGVVSQIAWQDPTRAADLAARLDEGQGLSNAYESIIRSWMKSDEFSAAKWLADLTPSESKDRAVRTFTNELFSMDPERAVQWAAAIDDRGMRTQQLEKLVKQWERVDSPSARAWQAEQEP